MTEFEQMVKQMAVILQYKGSCSARAAGCDRFGNHENLEEAMRLALELRDGQPPSPAPEVKPAAPGKLLVRRRIIL